MELKSIIKVLLFLTLYNVKIRFNYNWKYVKFIYILFILYNNYIIWLGTNCAIKIFLNKIIIHEFCINKYLIIENMLNLLECMKIF